MQDQEIKDAVANDVKTTVTAFTYKAQEGTTLVSFDKALLAFVNNTKLSMVAARMATDLAIVHYYNTGDLSYCQRFLDSIPKNYVRRTAYLSWLSAYSPIIVAKDRLYKDKREEAALSFGSTADHPMTVKHVEAALSKSFWDHKPEPEIIDFEEGAIIGQLLKGVNTLRGKRYNLSDGAITKLNEAEAVLVKLQ